MELMGVYEQDLVEPLAQVMAKLGVVRGMVVYGQDKLDEISMSAPTSVCEIRDGWFQSYEIAPEQFGYQNALRRTGGRYAEENAGITRAILAGRERGAEAKRRLPEPPELPSILPGKAKTMKEGVNLAEKIIDQGLALKKLEKFIQGEYAMNILETIVERTRERIQKEKQTVPLEEVRRQAEEKSASKAGKMPRFEKALRKNELSFICEVKKASPSKGIIAEDFPYLSIALDYEMAGAAAISCLTEPYWFLA